MCINKQLQTKEYNFLTTEKCLKDKLMFLVLGGSHAYGTNNENSDVDVRGCVFQSKKSLLGLESFEQFSDEKTDTTIYGFNKLIKLLVDCNPNCIELLGSKPEHYCISHPIGKEFIDSRKMFLSLRAVRSFSGYATQQLRRLQNAVARDSLTEQEKERHILHSLNNAIHSFNDRYSKVCDENINVHIGEYIYNCVLADGGDSQEELLVDVKLKGYPLRDYKGMWFELQEIVKQYDKLNKRNKKKDENHLNKHAMHLIRLYYMVLDILEKEEIITYREENIEELRAIRNGKYMNSDGTYHSYFFELVTDLENRVEYASKNSSLLKNPNLKRIEEFMMYVNEISLKFVDTESL